MPFEASRPAVVQYCRERKYAGRSVFCNPSIQGNEENTMSRFQAGALVVYGNLGVHEVETVGLRRFCDEPAREYYTLRPYFSDSHDRSYIPTEKEAALRPVTPAQQAEADLARIKAEKLPIPAGVQTALAEHYQALLHTNDFYQYLTLFKELGQKQTQQQSRGRKINAMDAYFYQMIERVLRVYLPELLLHRGADIAAPVEQGAPRACGALVK